MSYPTLRSTRAPAAAFAQILAPLKGRALNEFRHRQLIEARQLLFIDVDGSEVTCFSPGFEYRGHQAHTRREERARVRPGDANGECARHVAQSTYA
jgi:hypothetical protein